MQPAPIDKLPRITAIDVARGLALVAMAIYHFAWDLEFFGCTEPGMTEHGGWKLFARADAASFLFLVGVGLVLAHGRAIRWASFGRRFLMIAAAAAAITLVTWFAVPEAFIFFGILHEIALASVFGLAFLRLPSLLTLAVAAFVVVAPHFLRMPLFDHPAWWWAGLSSQNPVSNDYVPIFPWFGAVLTGIAVTKFACDHDLLERLARLRPGSWSRPLVFFGRHSLAFYLIHQPLLIGLVWAFAQVWPAASSTPQARFAQACHAQCIERREAEFCTPYCACALNIVESEGLLGALFEEAPEPEAQKRTNEIAQQCTTAVDSGEFGRGSDE